MKKIYLILVILFSFDLMVSSQIQSPILITPPNTTNMVLLTPTLVWDAVPNAINYSINISLFPDCSSTLDGFIPPINLTSPSYQIVGGILLPNTTYYWQITANGENSSQGVSLIFSFTTFANSHEGINSLTQLVQNFVISNVIPDNQGNILVDHLNQTINQIDLNNYFPATVMMQLFIDRVDLLQNSLILDQENASILNSNADAIINFLNLGNRVINNVNNNTAHSFNLGQNYPNPFNPVTDIEYSVPKNSHISLKIFYITGKEVATLIDKYQQSGKYLVIWNAVNFGSGVYFYQLSDGKNISTKKMTLIK